MARPACTGDITCNYYISESSENTEKTDEAWLNSRNTEKPWKEYKKIRWNIKIRMRF